MSIQHIHASFESGGARLVCSGVLTLNMETGWFDNRERKKSVQIPRIQCALWSLLVEHCPHVVSSTLLAEGLGQLFRKSMRPSAVRVHMTYLRMHLHTLGFPHLIETVSKHGYRHQGFLLGKDSSKGTAEAKQAVLVA